MKNKIVLLLAQSARSVAYVQALCEAKIDIFNVIIYGDSQIKINTSREITPVNSELFCPDLTIGLEQSLAKTNWPVWQCESKHLENEQLLAKLNELSPTLIVFSGYGGQIVPMVLLEIAPILHIHSGLLPEFPGSTTIYYQILAQQCCGASAILLDETIDTGPILAKKTYPLPNKHMDIDYLYDTMIRADLLVEVLIKIKTNTVTKAASKQESRALPYYIIHPLLKHIAIMSSDKASQKQGQKID